MTAYAFQVDRNRDKRRSGDEPPEGPNWDLIRWIVTTLGSLAFALVVWALIVGIFCVGG